MTDVFYNFKAGSSALGSTSTATTSPIHKINLVTLMPSLQKLAPMRLKRSSDSSVDPPAIQDRATYSMDPIRWSDIQSFAKRLRSKNSGRRASSDLSLFSVADVSSSDVSTVTPSPSLLLPTRRPPTPVECITTSPSTDSNKASTRSTRFAEEAKNTIKAARHTSFKLGETLLRYVTLRDEDVTEISHLSEQLCQCVEEQGKELGDLRSRKGELERENEELLRDKGDMDQIITNLTKRCEDLEKQNDSLKIRCFDLEERHEKAVQTHRMELADKEEVIKDLTSICERLFDMVQDYQDHENTDGVHSSSEESL